MRVEPDDAQAVIAHRQALDCAHVRATASAEHDRAFRKRAREREVLLAERVLVDDARLGIGKRQVRGLRHRLAARAPRARDPHEPSANVRPHEWHS